MWDLKDGVGRPDVRRRQAYSQKADDAWCKLRGLANSYEYAEDGMAARLTLLGAIADFQFHVAAMGHPETSRE